MPAGVTPGSRHFEEALTAGCVPVIISDRWQPKYELQLDYSRFSLFHSEYEVHNLLPRLFELTAARIRQLQEGVRRACPYFKYHYPAIMGDATYSALEEWVFKLCRHGRLL